MFNENGTLLDWKTEGNVHESMTLLMKLGSEADTSYMRDIRLGYHYFHRGHDIWIMLKRSKVICGYVTKGIFGHCGQIRTREQIE